MAVIVATCSVGSLTTATAAPLGQGALDQQTRQEAIDAIPFDQLTEASRQKLWSVVSQPSIYRQLPITVTEADPDLHVHLVRYPEVVVSMWQLMGITKVQIQRTSDFTFKAADGAGTVCDVQLIYGDSNLHVYYAEGSYEGALLRKLIRGNCVMVLRSDYHQTETQQVFVTNRLDMFVQLDNVGAEILAKTLHPLVGKSADHNFIESTRFLGQVSQAAEARSSGLQQLAARLENIDEPVRERFVEVAANANRRAAQRLAGPTPRLPESERMNATTVPVVRTVPIVVEAPQVLESPDERNPLRLRR